MPGGRHSVPPADPALTVADIVSAREDFQRSRRRADLQTRDTSWRWSRGPFIAAAILGIIIGAAIPPGDLLPGGWGRVSNALGWVYLLSWSVAEYPMLYFDYKRKAASEDSLDHVAFYLIGDASYTAFTCILLWSKFCREPREGCQGRADSIHLNDTLFSIHSTICTLALLWQLLAFSPRAVELSLQCWIVIVSVAVIAAGGLVLALRDSSYLTVPAYLYGVSFLRVGSCVMEQMPTSAGKDHRGTISMFEKSCKASAQCALFCGGLVSVAQQTLDAAAARQWSIITGNLTKVLLGVLTAGFSAAVLLREHSSWVMLKELDRKNAAQQATDEDRREELSQALIENEDPGSSNGRL